MNMGTRSLTYVYETFKNDKGQRQNEPILCMYGQYDGYPSGVGAELAVFLTSGKLVNGIGLDAKNVFNGMGCLAAQLVAHFKTEAGGFYLRAPRLDRDDWQDYEYHIFEDSVVVYEIGSNNNNPLFDGTWADFAKFCAKELAKGLVAA